MLTGVYSHTGAHILAAPMAHYLALHGSRFRYSHSTIFLPAHGIEQHLLDAQMIMQYRDINGSKKAYHYAMDYLFRPPEMENVCAYTYYSTYYRMNKKAAKKMGLDCFAFTEDHPLHETQVAVKFPKKVIPVWTWNWLQSTSSFKHPLSVIAKKEDCDYHVKETYARRLMVLFVPLRTSDDLTIEGCHQHAFQNAHRKGMLNEHVIEVANNIQDIHNSLASDMPENVLTKETVYCEAADFEEVRNSSENHVDMEELLANIGSILAGSANTEPLIQEASILTPERTMATTEITSERAIFNDIEDVFDVAHTATNMFTKETADPHDRFQVSTSQLNTLTYHCFVTKKPESELPEADDASADALDSSENGNVIHDEPVYNVDATGTADSIIAWGINAGLDEDQQTAFEILAATYVLSFHADASSDLAQDTIALQNLVAHYDKLCQLARRKPDDKIPLRLFVTGPAGAGKCKYILGCGKAHHFFLLTAHPLAS